MTYENGTAGAHVQRAWLLAVALVLANLALIGVLFSDAVVGAIRVWNGSETFTHCYLIVPICLYLLWEKRAELARVAPRPWPLALVAMLPLLALALVGQAGSILELEQFALIAMVQAMLLAVLGWPVYRIAWFAFLYLFLLVPSGEWLVPALQDFTADFAVGALRLIGIPTLHDGIMIYIPNGSFRVAEACAGLRFLIATIAYGLLFAYLVYRSWPRRLIFVALSFVVPVIANGFRAFGIIWLAHITDNAVAVAADHLVYGWIFFALVLLLLTWIGFGFREDVAEAKLPPPAAVPTSKPAASTITAAAAAVLIAAGPAWAMIVGGPARSTEISLQPPAAAAPWQPSERRLDDWRIQHPNADTVLVQAYAKGDTLVQLEIAYYAYQRDGAEVVAHDNRLSHGDTWRRVEDIDGRVTPDGQPLASRGERLEKGGRLRLVAMPWYWVDDTFTTSPLQAKLLQISGRLLSGRLAAAQIVVAARYEDDPAEALAAIADLVSHLGPLQPVLSAPQRSE